MSHSCTCITSYRLRLNPCTCTQQNSNTSLLICKERYSNCQVGAQDGRRVQHHNNNSYRMGSYIIFPKPMYVLAYLPGFHPVEGGSFSLSFPPTPPPKGRKKEKRREGGGGRGDSECIIFCAAVQVSNPLVYS